jgi:hypothetical protein
MRCKGCNRRLTQSWEQCVDDELCENCLEVSNETVFEMIPKRDYRGFYRDTENDHDKGFLPWDLR